MDAYWPIKKNFRFRHLSQRSESPTQWDTSGLTKLPGTLREGSESAEGRNKTTPFQYPITHTRFLVWREKSLLLSSHNHVAPWLDRVGTAGHHPPSSLLTKSRLYSSSGSCIHTNHALFNPKRENLDSTTQSGVPIILRRVALRRQLWPYPAQPDT